MKTIQPLHKLFLILMLLTSSLAYGQKKDKDTPKKIHLLPVFLNYYASPDTTFNQIVLEAFTRHKVKLINKKEFEQLNDGEVLRVGSLFRTRQNQFGSESELRAAIAKEQRFVSNMLTIVFIRSTVNDSLMVTSAKWENTPYPPGVNSIRSSGDKSAELQEPCCTIREQVFALVDEILYSKWLR